MKKILLVDDSPDFVGVMKQRLESSNYSVVGTSRAGEIVELAEKESPDLIILDIVMPEMNGYEVCERLRQGKKTKSIPIMLLTGKELEPKGIVERCFKLGVETFLLKPVDSKVLIDKIRKLIGD